MRQQQQQKKADGELFSFNTFRKHTLSKIETRAKQILDEYYFGKDFSKINVEKLNNKEVKN
jgi:hypothetical protein